MLRLDAVTYAHAGAAQTYRFDMLAEPSQVTAVSGPSGSGKSTLLDLIAGFLAPFSGSMVLDGQDLLALPPEQRPVSLLFQSESLFDHLTTARNVALGLPNTAPRREHDRLIARALEEVGLSGVESQRAGTLSGGQKQRVALARTLLRAKPILLLDEPFSALDDETRMTVRDLVARLTASHGWHTILVSHHADDVTALGNRRYRIKDGILMPE